MAIAIAALNPTKPPRRINRFYLIYALSLMSLAIFGALYADYQKNGNPLSSDPTFHALSDVAYVELPRVSLTLPSDGGTHPGHLRMDISVEVDKKYADRIDSYLPRISERIASFASHLSFDDVSQRDSAQKLRQYILEQANQAGAPVPIMNIVFRQYVII